MAFSRSPLSYADVRDALEQALASEKGVAIECPDHGAAIALRQRMNTFRKIDRSENRKVYPEDHPLHGNSNFDRLSLRVPPKGDANDNQVQLVKITEGTFSVKPL